MVTPIEGSNGPNILGGQKGSGNFSESFMVT
jgi:hypothetical protein